MKWWQITTIVVVFVLAGAYVGLSIHLGNIATRVERVPVEESPGDLGLDYEDVEFTSYDNALTLRGWYLPAKDSDGIIIMVQGGESHRADPSIGMLDIAAALVEHDYHVLMFDLRGHGESDGKRMSAGYFEKNDLLGAIEYSKDRGFERIGVLGFSMGGATALMTGAESSDIDCIVSDSAYTDLADIMGREFKARSGFPEFFLSPVLTMVNLIYDVDFRDIKPVEAVPQISPRPIFFIHGAEDTFVPTEHVHRLAEASANSRNELWIAPGAEHVRSYMTNPDEYISKITGFFNAVLR
ncbi:MAG: alpha/beta hydrolase [Dehalococcoidales bacterium]|nr:alpha/beta hydrolase [Dehalococcoidales bacterium]